MLTFLPKSSFLARSPAADSGSVLDVCWGIERTHHQQGQRLTRICTNISFWKWNIYLISGSIEPNCQCPSTCFAYVILSDLMSVSSISPRDTLHWIRIANYSRRKKGQCIDPKHQLAKYVHSTVMSKNQFEGALIHNRFILAIFLANQ